ncbi:MULTISPECIES: S24 family peptidase [unclassified Pseudomonas]|uniref:S24 family peptidase n=1 Tax=unclassified Pseudomonas TaxID=196821 RepID=UPI002B2357C1|nr:MULTISPECIES: S24 family peptidase [unclassified Pseudomonas]MEA9994568.1 S24 family peptidase [Pseudomonas sp. AA4]MEB0085713.1 S24 family peptidase [Pseudomonas sp. RTI1]MEB0125962.1 S24 family peptidase [Pseudomonas sp. CCC1.2]MEB0133396.1 S24 family peptidase [Pseudomonas sp. CCI2.4]MEB0152766.1 S24 family peptidase [Pseudomonas sp. CCC4.3]
MVQIEEIRNAFVVRLKQALVANEIQEWGAGARLAKVAGVTPKASSKWLNGESMPGGAKMLALAAALKVRVEWLEYGRGDMRELADPLARPAIQPVTPSILPFPTDDDGETPVTDEKYAFIPQYDAMASAGSGHQNTHVELRGTLAFKRDWLRLKGVNPKNLKVIYAHGESMWPTIDDHDVLLVDESRVEPVDGQIFALESQERGTLVKRLMKSEFGGWIIRSDNADKINHGDLVLPDGEIYEHRILGRVIWRGGDL